jgi:hypothetical protein
LFLVLDLYESDKQKMKAFHLVLLVCLFNLNQACAQKQDDITAITLTKQTRGYVEEVVISRDSVHAMIENHRAPEQSKHFDSSIDQDEWASVVMTLNNVDLPEVDGLQSPSTDRARDAAMQSTIVISFKDGKSVSHSFDDENPHPDLMPLLDAIKGFRLPDARK